MQKIDDRPVYWCPNCGTTNEHTGSFVRTEPPGLLRRLVDCVANRTKDAGNPGSLVEIEVIAGGLLKSIKVNGREIL